MRLADAAATEALAVELGRALDAGAVLVLTGEMGAGKTTFVRGLARGLGVPSRVTSPTFVLCQRHEGGRLPLVHADAWRLGSGGELDALNLFEDAADGVLALEWGDRFPDVLPPDHLRVALREDGAGREVEFVAAGPGHQRWVAWLEGRGGG